MSETEKPRSDTDGPGIVPPVIYPGLFQEPQAAGKND
jgi:hypothetical protein